MTNNLHNSPLPKEFLASLEEHTAGGFIFVRTTLDGKVEQHMSFDDEVSYLAILSKTRNLLRAMEAIDHEFIIEHISPTISDEEQNEEDYGSEDED